jgi:DNA-binding MarR family transcriptional regulator
MKYTSLKGLMNLNDIEISKIIGDLTFVMPVFFRKMSKVQNEILGHKEISKSHLEILFVLNREGMSTMTSLGKAIFVSKPNITVLVDRLIELNLVVRAFNENDRRIVYIQLTTNGKSFIEEYKETYKKYIKEKLIRLDEEDLRLLQVTMDNMKKLISKSNTEEI